MSRETTNFNTIENTQQGIYDALLTLREDFDSHIHDGTNSRSFETLLVKTLVAGNSVMAVNSLAVTKKSYTDDTAGIWMGINNGVAKLYIGTTTNSVKWDGSTLTITGSITATTGTIGGFSIGATTISATNLVLTSGAANVANISVGTGSNLGGMNSANASGDIAFWAGDTFANRASAPFRVTAGGALVATSATITGTITSTSGTIGGFTIGATTISGGSTLVLDSTGTGIITGGLIRTASSGSRVEMAGATNEFKFYNGSTFVGSFFSSSTTGIGFFDSSGVLNAAVLSTNGDVAISKSGGSFLTQSGGTFGWLTHNNALTSISSGIIQFNGELRITKIAKSTGGANVIDLSGTGQILTNQNFNPSSAAGASLGDATLYWNDVSYKTLTDRGCLGWFDEGVEMQDGTIVSDTEALLQIKKHPTKKTVYGRPMLDYTSLPKSVYRPADRRGVLIARNADNEPVEGQDGAETTALISIMLGAIKELTKEIQQLKSTK